MALCSRILVGLIGLLSLFSAAQHWFGIEALVNERGLQAIGDVGRANMRADVGGIFVGIGLFAIMAAWKESRMWLSATILLVGGALLGRFISVAIDGYTPRVGAPMLIEAIVIAIFAFAYFWWGKKPEGL
jgi:hypothetical protein